MPGQEHLVPVAPEKHAEKSSSSTIRQSRSARRSLHVDSSMVHRWTSETEQNTGRFSPETIVTQSRRHWTKFEIVKLQRSNLSASPRQRKRRVRAPSHFPDFRPDNAKSSNSPDAADTILTPNQRPPGTLWMSLVSPPQLSTNISTGLSIVFGRSRYLRFRRIKGYTRD